ncbi:hypothetical protein [Nocardia tengchongensis]|uniref:hypothetical protein n=1 Tax=Nocardia tengchongensis TaxID=2055889 RepID=UPI0036BAAA7D
MGIPGIDRMVAVWKFKGPKQPWSIIWDSMITLYFDLGQRHDPRAITRPTQAEREGWAGEIEGIDLTLRFLRHKREQTLRLTRLAPQPTALTLVPTRRSSRR